MQLSATEQQPPHTTAGQPQRNVVISYIDTLVTSSDPLSRHSASDALVCYVPVEIFVVYNRPSATRRSHVDTLVRMACSSHKRMHSTCLLIVVSLFRLLSNYLFIGQVECRWEVLRHCWPCLGREVQQSIFNDVEVWIHLSLPQFP